MLRAVSVLLVAASLLVMLVISGCPAPTAEAPDEDETRVAGTEEQATTLPVTITDDRLMMEETEAPAGDITLDIVNEGTSAQAVQVEGEGFSETSAQIQPGERTSLVMQDVQPGTYEVFVVGMRDDPAMRATLTVTERTAMQDGVVNINMTNDGFEADPSFVPYGDTEINVVNRSDRAKTFSFEGMGMNTEPQTIRPDEQIRFHIQQTGDDEFVITMPDANGNGTQTGQPEQRQQPQQRQPEQRQRPQSEPR